jgi:hypothetical protein
MMKRSSTVVSSLLPTVQMTYFSSLGEFRTISHF